MWDDGLRVDGFYAVGDVWVQAAAHAGAGLRRFVFCRQRQDERLRRGGEQKSVVVLSMFPYSSVLGPLSQWAGPAFFNCGHQALERVRVIQPVTQLKRAWGGGGEHGG